MCPADSVVIARRSTPAVRLDDGEASAVTALIGALQRSKFRLDESVLVGEFVLELLELGPPAANELELVADVVKRAAQDPLLLGGILGLAVLAPQLGARRLGFEQLRQLVEREPEQVTQTD